MGLKTKVSAIALTVCMALTALPVSASAEGTAAGKVERINVQGERAAAYMIIRDEFAAKEQEVKLVYNEEERTGDILVDIDRDKYQADYGKEGYSIESDNGIVTVKAAESAGAGYGLRDVLKQLESRGQVADKEISIPSQKIRALFVDCARKYFSVEWFETVIREMAWNGMNTLYMSFSNDEGFRFLLDDMSVSFDDGNGAAVEYDHEYMKHLGDNPRTIDESEFLTKCNEGASDAANGINSYDCEKYLTQDEMVKILTYAKAYGINIIPEFNSPGHTGQLLWYFPEYRNIGIWGIGSNPCYALNLENAEAKNFMAALIKKYIDFFYENGCTDFCVGGDEFAAHGSTDETVAEYVNGLVDYVESKGMTAYAWVDGQAGESGLLKKSVIVNDWKSKGAKASEYQVVNFNNDFMYYVLKSYDWTINPKRVFEEWNPLLFNGNSQVEPESAAAANVLGASMAIWCDDAGAKDLDMILTDMMTDIKSFGYRTWNYDPQAENTVSYEDFISSAKSAAVLEEADVLGAVEAADKLSVLDEQLREAESNARAAKAAETDAQNILAAAQGRVAAAEQKVAAAQDKIEKLKAEEELFTARVEENKLAAEAAEKSANAARMQAEAAKIKAEIFKCEGNTEGAEAKESEFANLTAAASLQEDTAKAKRNSQAGIETLLAAKKAELASALNAPEIITTATKKEITYKVLDADKKTAVVTGTANKNLSTVAIPPVVMIGDVNYEVTQIGAKAFKGMKKLRTVTIGSNIQKIGKEAFAQCSKLKKVNMKKAKGITSIQKKAFSKINAKAKITVPAKKKNKYKKLLKQAGLPKKAVVK